MNLRNGYWKLVIVSVRKWSLDVTNKVWDSNNRRGLKYEIWLLLEARNWLTDGSWLLITDFSLVIVRWKDNDQYLHVNNAVYHAIFDSAINIYLIRWLSFKKTSDLTGNTTSTEELGWILNQSSHLGA